MAMYRFAIVVLVLAGILAVRPVRAQDYPNRPVHLIVPYAPGGGADIVARLVAPKLTEAWSQSVIVENKPGANGVVASEYAMQQQADGYTIIVGTLGSHGIMQYLNPNLGYDPLHDFTGITALVYSPLICLVLPSGPYHSMRELVDDAKMRPVSFGSPGVGSQMQLIGETFNLEYGTHFQHIAYRGVAPAMQDLIGGHIPMAIGEMGSAKPLVTAGQLRALAITGTRRNASVPDVPTFAEAGYAGFDESSWFALYVIAATPKPIVDKIARDVTAIVQRPDLSARLAQDGWEPGGGAPEDFNKMWMATSAKLGDVIRQRHITLQ